MTHGDDSGLVLPPAVAPVQVVVVPIAQHKEGVVDKAQELHQRLASRYRTRIDLSDNSPGWKFAQYEMKGVPVRLELGPKDIEKGQCVLLGEIHNSLYQKALENRERRTYTAASMEEILSIAGDPEKTGFIRTMWCEDPACEARMKEEAGLTSRCMPLEQEHLYDVCPICGKPAKSMIIWGKAY